MSIDFPEDAAAMRCTWLSTDSLARWLSASPAQPGNLKSLGLFILSRWSRTNVFTFAAPDLY
jgi:hypothetical protein